MRNITLCGVLLLIFCTCSNLYAQHIISRKLPFFYELASNEIFDIYQDKEGYLWIGTTNGLARYDGYRLQSFRSDYKDLSLLTDNTISSIADNEQYVWIGTRKGLNLYDKHTCRIVPFPDERLLDKNINYMIADHSGTVWLATGKKIYKCSPDATKVEEYELLSRKDYLVNAVYADREGNVWALTNGIGLFRYDAETDSFISYPRLGASNAPYTMYQDVAGNYWIGTWGEGLWQFFPDKTDDCYKRHHIINTRTGLSEPIFYSMVQDDTFGYLWLLSYNELYALKYTEDGRLESVDIHDRVDTHMMYTKILKDREGNLWLGSYDMAYTIFFDHSKIDNYPLEQLKEQMGWDVNILNLCMDKESLMWISQDRYGLCLYDLQRNLLVDNKNNEVSGLGEVELLVKSRAKDGIWVTPRYVPRAVRVAYRDMSVCVEEDINLSGQASGSIKKLTEDSAGNLWILTKSALFIKQPDVDKPVVSGQKLPMMHAMAAGPDGYVWGVGSDKCLYRLRYSNGQIVLEDRVPVQLLSEQEEILHISLDSEGCLWLVSSLGRIFRSDQGRRTFKNMPLDSRLDNCSVLGMVAEKDFVWIATNKKVLQYNIRKETCVDYGTTDENIEVDVFRYKAISPDGLGGLYVGGHHGFVHIQSDTVSAIDVLRFRPVATDVRSDNQSVLFGGRNTASRVVLDSDARNIEISFSPLRYALNSKKLRMAYRLEGADKDWIYLDYGKSSAFYNRLRKGTYHFKVKMEDGQGGWTVGETLLTLVKLPAFYETWWAYAFYLIVAVSCAYSMLRFYIRRMKLKNEAKLKEEMVRTKLNYFTNVSHELLTPLTVISCMSDYMEQKVPAVRQQCDVLKSNVDRLKRLIQQILDFRKVDVGKMKLSVTEGDAGAFIQTLCNNNFRPLADQKNISLEISIEPVEIKAWLDFDKLDKILYNLLSNAVKYTPEGKTIRITAYIVHKEGVRFLGLKVADEGVGIASGELARIFTRFYSDRKNKGVESNGIGLSLTKDLVCLHHGNIDVESTLGSGSCFTVEIPVDKEAYAADERVEEVSVLPADEIASEPNTEAEPVLPEENTDRPTLLLIDDNTELLYIMRELFKDSYGVLTAADGGQAWEQLTAHTVDVIICDVMLPDVSGWELCSRMKADLRFNHIPVIILTAKNGADDQVTSYNVGAEGYIAKPFDMKVLSARIDNLIKASRRRQAAFRKEKNVSLEDLAYPSADRQFLQAVIESIEAHLEQSEFDLDQLSKEVNMSKSTLYRKIKSMTGLTPLDFVRNVKMKRACMMLSSHSVTISEVAYAVGFNNPKYFTKCFKEEFGVTPTEYQQMQPS